MMADKTNNQGTAKAGTESSSRGRPAGGAQNNQTPTTISTKAGGLADLAYDELPLSIKFILNQPENVFEDFMTALCFYELGTDSEKKEFRHPLLKTIEIINKNFAASVFKTLVDKRWRRQMEKKNKKVETSGPSPTQTKQDNFNKNASIFAKNPHQSPEPTSYTPQKPVSLLPSFSDEEKRQYRTPSKVEPINREKAKALKIIDNVDKDNLPPPKTQPSFDPVSEKKPPPPDPRPHESDDEPSEEDGLDPSEAVPFKIIVAEHVPFSFLTSNLALTLYDTFNDYLAPYAMFFAFVQNVWRLKGKAPMDVIQIAIKYLMYHYGRKLVQWLFKWITNTFYFTYRCYLMKKKRRCYIDGRKIESYKEVLDDSRSLARQQQHQMTDRQDANFHFYEYKFYRRVHYGDLIPQLNHYIVKPVNKILRYVTGQPMSFNYRLPEMREYKITVHDWDFPSEFDRYVEYQDDTPSFANYVVDDKTFTFRRQGKTEVVHSDLLHRVWNASTFNMMNGVEQLHSRISNVINSSNDFVMYSREAKNSAINGTKNMISYLIQERYTKDPNRNFHKGSPEPSNMGIAYSISNIVGDPRFLKSLSLIFVLLIWLEFGNGWRSLNLYKSHWEYMSQRSHSLTRTYSTPLERLWEKLRGPMRLFLSLVIQILRGEGVVPFLF